MGIPVSSHEQTVPAGPPRQYVSDQKRQPAAVVPPASDDKMLKWRKRNKPKVLLDSRVWFLGRWFTHAITENALSRLRAHVRITRGQRTRLKLTTEGIHAIPRTRLLSKNDGEFVSFRDLEKVMVDDKYINIIVCAVRLSETQLELIVYRCADEKQAREISKAARDGIKGTLGTAGKGDGSAKVNWMLKPKGGENKRIFSSAAAQPPNGTVKQIEDDLKQRQAIAAKMGATVMVRSSASSPRQPRPQKTPSPTIVTVDTTRHNHSPSGNTRRGRNAKKPVTGTPQRPASFPENFTLKKPQNNTQVNGNHLRHPGAKMAPATKLASSGNRLPNGIPLVDIPVDNTQPSTYLRDKVVNLTKELERLKQLIEKQDVQGNIVNGADPAAVKLDFSSRESSPMEDIPDYIVDADFESEADSSSGVEVTLQRNPKRIPYIGHGVRATVDDYRRQERSPSPQRRTRDPKEMLDRHGQRVNQALIQTLDPKEKFLKNNTRGRLTRRQERDSGNDSMSRVSARSGGNRSRASSKTSAAASQRSSSGTRVPRRIEEVYVKKDKQRNPDYIVYYAKDSRRSQSASRVETRRPVALVW